MNPIVLRTLGILFWVALVAFAYAATHRSGSDNLAADLVYFVSGPSHHVVAVDSTRQLQEFDPVFLEDATGKWRQIGYVASESTNSDGTLTMSWYARDIDPSRCRFTQYRNSGRLEDVLTTMFPAETRLRIQDQLTAALSTHGDELSAAFVPLVQATVQKSLPVIEQEFRNAVDRRRADVNRIGQRWNEQVVGERLIPLARREIMPIVRTHGEPMAQRIGRELWDRASLWRFGWRAVYDRSPLPRRDLVQEEWDRFVDEEAVPVFEHHMDDIVAAVQRILSDVAANDAVRSELADVAGQLAEDPDTRQLFREILKETLVENDRLKQVWSEVWSSRQARAALDMAGDRLEPVVRGIGDELFGTQQDGINPNFARVLRNQILGKDRRWIVARVDVDAAASARHTIDVGDHAMPYPIVYTARPTDGGWSE